MGPFAWDGQLGEKWSLWEPQQGQINQWEKLEAGLEVVGGPEVGLGVEALFEAWMREATLLELDWL